MANYWVNNNAQANGDHEVHKDGCTWMPSSKTYLGDFGSCQQAVVKARQVYRQSNGCAFCAPGCHTS
jgi:hypothetical protein